MIDLSNIKAPGWQRVVAELVSPAQDDGAFLSRLVAILAQVSGARQAVLFSIAPSGEGPDSLPPEPRALFMWMPSGAAVLGGQEQAPDDRAIEHVREAKAAVRSAAASKQVGVFGLDREDALYDDRKGYVIGVPLQSGADSPTEARGVVTLLLEPRSRQALQTTLALVEVLAGYMYTHAAQQALRRTRQTTASLDLAARLIATLNTSNSFKGATLQLVNDICRQVGVDRVSLGWIGGGTKPRGRVYCKVLAISDTENVDRRMVMVQKIEAAMDECVDQGQPIVYPAPPAKGEGADFVLSQAIVHAHRELSVQDKSLKVASLPMRVNEQIVGALTIETTSGAAIESGTIELLQATLDLIAPVVEIRRSDDRMLALRTWDWMLKVGAWLVGPKHTVWKVVAALVFIGALLATFVKLPYRVGAAMELQPLEPRIISAPFDGQVRAIGEGVEPGQRVEQGQALVELDTTDLYLSLQGAREEVYRSAKQADEARNRGELGQAQQHEARAKQAEARVDLLNRLLGEARIVAPISGTIIRDRGLSAEGNLRQKIGSSVKLGEPLLTVADVRQLLVVAKVEDRDISLIREGMTGEITTKADPSREFKFTVERIVPLAEARDGANIFEVRCRLEENVPGLRPGMQGRAKFDVDRRPLISIASRRIVDQLRLWLWW